MDIGFETIGNATVIAYDRGQPVVATDPWVHGSAYFGSWVLSHEVPAEQREAVQQSKYVWFSHGHPDHLNGDSLALLQGKQLLVPDHVGGRIRGDLEKQGFQVRVLPDRTWVELSPRVRALCIPDFNQDAVLLLDINGRLVADLNDAGDRGWGALVRQQIRRYPVSYLLALASHGDADLMNYFDESGRRLPLPPRTPLGATCSARANWWGARYCIPFSAMHRYQRADSAWAAAQTASLDDYRNGWSSKRCELLPAFVRVDCERDQVTSLAPREIPPAIVQPKEFGDDWSERLEPAEKREVARYFEAIEKLRAVLDFIAVRVGGEDTVIPFARRRFRRGLTFEAPRASLLSAVRWEIFDDLLIGNFVKVTLHGEWGPGRLYPDFTPWVAKYADNGRAKTRQQLRAYFANYRMRDPIGHLRSELDARCLRPSQELVARILRERLGPETVVFQAAKKAWWYLRNR